MSFMYQCRMEQDDASTVGWIEERGAKVGAAVEVPELGGFWTIKEVYTRMEKSKLQEKQVADRKQREASDI